MVAVRPEPERSVAAVKTSSRRLYPKGSPSGEIASIRETRDGTLWVGTYAGLVRLEGERFVPEGAGVFPKGHQQGMQIEQFVKVGTLDEPEKCAPDVQI